MNGLVRYLLDTNAFVICHVNFLLSIGLRLGAVLAGDLVNISDQ